MNKSLRELTTQVVTHSSLQDIKKEGELIIENNSLDETVSLAYSLFSSDKYQVRMLATYILGRIASQSIAALKFLRDKVGRDTDWRVQELFAMAFDRYCSDRGYEKSLSIIKEWLQDKNPNVRRAVIEGLRIWTNKEYFKQHPQVAIELLSKLKADESEYVRKSVGNAIRDISKRKKSLVAKELQKWNLDDKRTQQTYSLASKLL